MLNAEPGIGDEDHAMADSISRSLIVGILEKLAGNWLRREVENLVLNRRTICGPSLNDQLIAQYFVIMHFAPRANLTEEDHLMQMHLLITLQR